MVTPTINSSTMLGGSGVMPESARTYSGNADLKNFTAIFAGTDIPPQVLADCVEGILPLLTNGPDEPVCRAWEGYLSERERLLRGKPFDLFQTLYRFSSRLGGLNYDYAVPSLHLPLANAQWFRNRTGFYFPTVPASSMDWRAKVVFKLTTLVSVWAIAPETLGHEDWSEMLRNFPFSLSWERDVEQLIDAKLRPEPSRIETPIPEPVKVLLEHLSQEPLSRSDLERRLAVKRTTLRDHYIEPAERLGLVEKTCAQRFSRDQRYRLTARGRDALAPGSCFDEDFFCRQEVHSPTAVEGFELTVG